MFESRGRPRLRQSQDYDIAAGPSRLGQQDITDLDVDDYPWNQDDTVELESTGATGSEAPALSTHDDVGLRRPPRVHLPNIGRPSLRRLPTPKTPASNRHIKKLKKFWLRRVSVEVPQKWSRDHLALERTFLAYVRTSVTMTMIAAFIIQFYTLKPQGQTVERVVTFQELAKPLSATLVSSAVINQVLGALRFWRQQSAMLRGAIYPATWEVLGCGILVAFVSESSCLVFFAYKWLTEISVNGGALCDDHPRW